MNKQEIKQYKNEHRQQVKKECLSFEERHPYMPLVISVIALLVSIIKPL
jgi:hypothetical protein